MSIDQVETLLPQCLFMPNRSSHESCSGMDRINTEVFYLYHYHMLLVGLIQKYLIFISILSFPTLLKLVSYLILEIKGGLSLYLILDNFSNYLPHPCNRVFLTFSLTGASGRQRSTSTSCTCQPSTACPTSTPSRSSGTSSSAT